MDKNERYSEFIKAIVLEVCKGTVLAAVLFIAGYAWSKWNDHAYDLRFHNDLITELDDRLDQIETFCEWIRLQDNQYHNLLLVINDPNSISGRTVRFKGSTLFDLLAHLDHIKGHANDGRLSKSISDARQYILSCNLGDLAPSRTESLQKVYNIVESANAIWQMPQKNSVLDYNPTR